MSINQVFQILLARIWVTIITVLIGVSVCALVVSILPEKYTATSSVILEVGDQDPVTGMAQNTARTYIQTQVNLVKSARVANKVVDRLELTRSPYFLSEYNSLNDPGIDLKGWIGKQLQENLGVWVVGGSEIIEISYTATSPTLAATVSNAFSEAYLLVDLELRVDPAKRNAQWFAAQLNKLRQNLTEAQNSLNDYQKQVGIVSMTTESQSESQSIINIESRAAAARAEASEARSMVQQFAAFLDSGGSSDSLPSFMTNPEISSLQQELGKVDAAIATLSGRVGENHPQYKAVVARRDQVTKQLAEEIEKFGLSLKARVQIAEAKSASLEDELDIEKDRMLQEKAQLDRLEAMEREVEIRKAEYDNAFRRAGTLRLEGDRAQTGVSIIEEATPPTEASFPQKRLSIAIAFAACLVLGVSISFLLEMIDRRVRSEADLILYADLKVLASIAKGPKKRNFFSFRRTAKSKNTTASTNEHQLSKSAAE
ncbi:hypothetical protein GCM10017044_20430 [Kordiimonas sediminis]|uniref:Polysaccharide chain length determinant N-terminal domain-containing protein n=1 Tax=Kordiimonas sediminis TaxID=1735581 RepID=A0A919ATN1_9PROT|nr:Wzz/FepE/Etk N-terminal domain-containing protein [Kordiimonas sediminis]GHF25534.1 hypothetical protein GCM10017044_20430 [Kordiimonas sediminis]